MTYINCCAGQKKDGLKVAPPLEISRTKETCTEFPLRKGGFHECLCNRRLSGSGKSTEPTDTLILLIRQPLFDP